MNWVWKWIERFSQIVSVFGTVFLIALAIWGLVWAMRSFRQMELDFRFLSPVEGQAIRGMLRVDGVFSGRFKNYNVTLDGETVSRQVPFYINSNDIDDGSHVLALEITRPNGTASKISDTTFLVDNQAPNINVRYPTEGQIVSGLLSVDFEIRGAREDVPPQVQIDGRDWELVSILDTKSLSDGPHVLTVMTEDNVGNVGRVLVQFLVDNTAPRIHSIGADDAGRLRGTVTLDAAIEEENIQTVEWFLGGDHISSSLPLVLDTTDLDDGAYTLELRVADSAGHRAASSVQLEIDNTPPQLTWALPESDAFGVYRERRLPLGIRSDFGTDVVVFRNGDVADSRFLDLSAEKPGSQVTIHAVATDSAGNQTQLECALVVEESIASDLRSLQVVGRAAMSKLHPFLKAMLYLPYLLLDAHLALSFELCPPQVYSLFVWKSLGA